MHLFFKRNAFATRNSPTCWRHAVHAKSSCLSGTSLYSVMSIAVAALHRILMHRPGDRWISDNHAAAGAPCSALIHGLFLVKPGPRPVHRCSGYTVDQIEAVRCSGRHFKFRTRSRYPAECGTLILRPLQDKCGSGERWSH